MSSSSDTPFSTSSISLCVADSRLLPISRGVDMLGKLDIPGEDAGNDAPYGETVVLGESAKEEATGLTLDDAMVPGSEQSLRSLGEQHVVLTWDR
mmetsp:Transcript_84484/g.161510  ORF Transcript_84484/g.161510 Transcript_84484/m.161510 type:complete len:95 (+) Transcript_84484:1761-2045(+)